MTLDPVAVTALLVSIVALAYTWLTTRDQNRRWDALNLARFAVRDLELATWREITRGEHEALEWGYDNPYVTVAPGEAGGLGADRLRVPVGIVAYRKNSDFVTGIVGITVAEVERQIAERGHDRVNYFLVKYYMLKFALENAGPTAANNTRVAATARYGAEEVGSLPEVSGGTVVPGERIYSLVRWATPLDRGFPTNLIVTIAVTFTDTHGETHTVKHQYEYDVAVSAFRRA